MNEKTRKKILELHKKGLTAYEIAKRLSVSYGGVRYVTDPAFREYMSQAHKKYFAELKGTPEAQTPPGHSNITQEDIEWLSQHRQRIDHRNKALKRTAVFVFYSVAAYAIFAVLFAIFSIITYLSLSGAALFAVISCFAIGFAGASIPSGFEGEALIGVFLGVIIGLMLALL